MPFISHEKPDGIMKCLSRDHDPPGMMVLAPGTHVWQCSGCGETQTIVVPVRSCWDQPRIEMEVQQEPFMPPPISINRRSSVPANLLDNDCANQRR